jgi:hypothetical protein
MLIVDCCGRLEVAQVKIGDGEYSMRNFLSRVNWVAVVAWLYM